jgi:hypothetical protein
MPTGLDIEKGGMIAMAVAQVWKSSKFTIERNQGKTPGTVIFRLSGPFTARDMYGALSPNALRNTFEAEDGNDPHALHILDGGSLYGFRGAWADRQPLCSLPGQRRSAGCGGSESTRASTARDD